MPFPLQLWLIHPDHAMCDAFTRRFDGLPHVRVLRETYENLPPHDCFATAGNAYGIMTAGIDAAVVRFLGAGIMQDVQHHILDHYLGEQPVGSAFILPTHHAERPFLAHAPTMRMPGSIHNTDRVYAATFAAFLAVYHHNVTSETKIETLVFPAFGTGFGNVPFDEAARQMSAAYRHYLSPPHRLDWDAAIRRQRTICYDGERHVLNA